MSVRRPFGSAARRQWLVLTDRTQGPSGTGYTLENRIAVSRTLRHDFETLHIERLAPFFLTLRERLVSLAPQQRRKSARGVAFARGTAARRFLKTDTWPDIWATRWSKGAI